MSKAESNKAPIEQVAPKTGLPPKPGTRRKTRLDTRDVLTYHGKDPNFVYRFVENREGRIPDYLERGWEVVERAGDELVGDNRASVGHAIDSRVSIRSGNQILVLMRLHKDHAAEDAAIYNKELTDLEESLYRKKEHGEDRNGLVGDVKIQRN